ncbi:MAG: amphi-Trp domain-containing protein [Sedimenticola sp.]
MKNRDTRFRHESLQDSDSIQQILKAITKGIAKGKLIFNDEEDEIVMEPEGLLRLKLAAIREEGRHRVNIRISWQVEDEMQKEQKSLSVSSK